MQKIENSIYKFIQKHAIYKILVAVSGGQDSIYLTKIIEKLNKIQNKKK